MSTSPVDGHQDGDSRLRIDLPARLRPRRRLHDLDRARRARPQRRRRVVDGRGVRRRRCRCRGVPGAHPVRLLRWRTSSCRTRCSTRSRRRSARSSTARRSSCPCSSSALRLRFRPSRVQHSGRRAPGPPARRRSEVVPADVPGVLRASPARTGRRLRATIQRRAATSPPSRSVPTCCSAPRTSPAWSCTSRSARTCGCPSRRAPKPRSPGRRCWRTSPAVRSPSGGPRTATCCAVQRRRRCLAAYLYAAAGVGESSTDLAWDGQTMIYENGALLAETPRFPTGPRACRRRHRPRPAARRTSPHGDVRRQPPPPRPRRRRSGRSTSASIRRAGDIGLRRAVERFPFVPSDDDRLAQDCYEAYNIQVVGTGATPPRPSATRTSSSGCLAVSTRPTP